MVDLAGRKRSGVESQRILYNLIDAGTETS